MTYHRKKTRWTGLLLALVVLALVWWVLVRVMTSGVDVLGCTWDREAGATEECFEEP